jgi:hypothetical protein
MALSANDRDMARLIQENPAAYTALIQPSPALPVPAISIEALTASEAEQIMACGRYSVPWLLCADPRLSCGFAAYRSW